RLESLPVDLTVEQQHRVPALAQAESVGGDAEDGVHGLEQVRDEPTACDRMNEDRTVEDDVGGQQIGQSSAPWLRAPPVLERMTCQANPLGAIETRGYNRAELWRAPPAHRLMGELGDDVSMGMRFGVRTAR